MKGFQLARGAAWMYSAQVLTALFQLVYAAYVSRIVEPAEFGNYAVALAAGNLISLVSAAGLSQTIARAEAVIPEFVKSLQLRALIAGGVGATVTVLFARPWSNLWSTRGAADAIRFAGLAVLVSPTLGLASGLARRLGDFNFLAISTVGTSVAGFIAGALAISFSPSASALLLATVLPQWLLAIFLTLKHSKYLVGVCRLSTSKSSRRFNNQVMGTSIVAYAGLNGPRWACSVLFGPHLLGQWNRADTLTTLPLYQVQTALHQTLYPEFRRVGGSRTQQDLLTDLLVLLSWVVFPFVAFLSACAPHLVLILFGPKWTMAAQMSAVLALLGGCTLIATLLAAAVEAVGHFKTIWFAQGLRLFLIASLVYVASSAHYFMLLPVGLVFVTLSFHAVYLMFCTKAKLVNLRIVIKNYFLALLVSLAVWGGLDGLLSFFRGQREYPFILGLQLSLLVVTCTLLFVYRSRLPPMRIAKRYGLSRHPNRN